MTWRKRDNGSRTHLVPLVVCAQRSYCPNHLWGTCSVSSTVLSSQSLAPNPTQGSPTTHQSDGRSRHSSNTHSSFPQRIPSALERVLPPLFSQHHSFASSSSLCDTYSFQHEYRNRKDLQEAKALGTKTLMLPKLRYTRFVGIAGRGGSGIMNARTFSHRLHCVMVWVYTAGNRGMSQTHHGSSVVHDWNGAGSRSVWQNRCLIHMSDQLYLENLLASNADLFFN